MILTHIAACSKNRVIGLKNDLPWNIPEDLQYFKDCTLNHIMIMGRKTFESINSKPLPKRFHIVITHQSLQSDHPLLRYVPSIDEAVKLASSLLPEWPEEVFIVGGGEIYRQSLNIVDKIYLTLIHKDFEGDAYYPEIDEKLFKLYEKIDRSQPIPFSFLKFRKN